MIGTKKSADWPSLPRWPVAVIAVAITVLGSSPALASLVSEYEVERQAERAFAQMRARIPISRDVAARDYVDCVARSIIARLDERYSDMDWEIELFDHEAANAFAMPGGKIGVFTGIFSVADDQDALAAVLGHEVAHVVSQHALKRARKQVRNQLLVVAASGALGGDRGTTNMLGLGAQIGLGLPYGRKQEAQADSAGLVLMAGAGFDPRASISLWKNMSKKNPAAPPALLSSHPSSDKRLDALISELTRSLILFNQAHEHGRIPRCQ
ncbi:MAG: M48 family metallopeptidase [bacterium]|nr:M48 family metallopeptidase [bacterium]